MPRIINSILAICVTVSMVAAKLDYGPCPTGVQQTPYNSDLDGLYYLQYYDEIMEFVKPIFNALQNANGFDCFSFDLNKWTR